MASTFDKLEEQLKPIVDRGEMPVAISYFWLVCLCRGMCTWSGGAQHCLGSGMSEWGWQLMY